MANTTKRVVNEPVTFRANPTTIKEFKALCILKGVKANDLIEDFMSQVVAEARQKGEIL